MLVLTERKDHLERLQQALADTIQPQFVLHGRLAKKARAAQLVALDALAAGTPRVVLATGRLVGEGVDHPALARLVLASAGGPEGHAAAVRRPPALRARGQYRCARARLCRRRSSVNFRDRVVLLRLIPSNVVEIRQDLTRGESLTTCGSKRNCLSRRRSAPSSNSLASHASAGRMPSMLT